MVERHYRGLLWGLVILGLSLDISTKYGVFSWLYNDGRGAEYVVIDGGFELMAQFTGVTETGDSFGATLRTLGGPVLPRVNQGALFGLASEKGYLANGVFALVSVIAALAIIYWSIMRSTVSDRPLCAALGLILGGTLGNLYDRLVFSGVRDFVHWHYKDVVEWPVFNIADCCLVCGASLLLIQAFLTRSVAENESAEKISLSPAMAPAVK